MRYLLLTLLMAGLATGCGESTPGADATTDAQGDGGTGPQVTVTYLDASTAVTLAQLPTMMLPSGSVVVTLASVIRSAQPARPLEDLVIRDLIGGDGYRAAARTNCNTGMNGMPPILPTAADVSDRGYVNTVSRNLTWAESMGYPGCMATHDLAEVQLGHR